MVIVGAGDVARRLVHLARSEGRACLRWLSLARTAESAEAQRRAGMLPIPGDLDRRRTLARLQRLARSAFAVLYLAPPPNAGEDDPRLRAWLASPSPRHRRASARRRVRPRRPRTLGHVYVSTTGVYGDCAGERIDETRRVRPETARAVRRVAAERRWRAVGRRGFARPHGGQPRGAVILRAPGIYALERLPLDRLRARTPALRPEEDVYTNHIHAEDLARAVWRAIFRGRPGRVYNVVDDAEWRMGEYFDRVADAFGLPRPPRLTRLELAAQVSPMLLSFMNESRRIGNDRLKRELVVVLRYATPERLLGLATRDSASASEAARPTQAALF